MNANNFLTAVNVKMET